MQVSRDWFGPTNGGPGTRPRRERRRDLLKTGIRMRAVLYVAPMSGRQELRAETSTTARRSIPNRAMLLRRGQ